MATTLVRNRLLRACLPIRSATSSAEPVSDPNRTSKSRFNSTMSKCQGVRQRTDPSGYYWCDSSDGTTKVQPHLMFCRLARSPAVCVRAQFRAFSVLPIQNDLDPRQQEQAAEYEEGRQENVRDLLVNLMNTSPSKRELHHFLKRYVPQPELTSHIASGSSSIGQTRAPIGARSPREYVNALLAPSSRQIAVTKVEGPFEKRGWQSVASTLLKLQRLGLTSIVVTDNPQWPLNDIPAEINKTMIRESMALVEAIEKAGGRARPIYGGVLERGSSSGSLRVHLDFINSALENRQIPVLVPIMSSESGLQQPITANGAMIALSKELNDRKSTPAKIVVINNEGGIPNHERLGTAHSLINLQEEYDTIASAFEKNPEWQHSYPTAMRNLDMIRTCLAQLPTSSSAVIAPTSSLPSALITNLVTDKPLYSSSLPNSDLQRINRLRTTVLRHGIKINTYTNLEELKLNRLTELMEASFQKKLDEDGFYARLRKVLDSIIVAGDYEGAVVMTKERGKHDYHYYLDKFAIAPSSQGIGLTDILWKRMCDAYPELLWRSRQDNGVNKWYFERSNGYWRLKDTNWVLFWHGPKGFEHIEDYATIARSIPASFAPPKPKKH